MSTHYLMPGSCLTYASNKRVQWDFAVVGEQTSSHRLVFDAHLRKFTATRLIDPLTYKERGIEASVDDLVALLPPDELAKATAASIICKR